MGKRKMATCECLDCGRKEQCPASDYKEGTKVICFKGCYQKRFPEQVRKWRKEYARLHELINPTL